MHSIPDLLQRLQRDYGLTQLAIEKETGIPQPRLSRWSKGECPEACQETISLLAFAERIEREHSRLRKRARKATAHARQGA